MIMAERVNATDARLWYGFGGPKKTLLLEEMLRSCNGSSSRLSSKAGLNRAHWADLEHDTI